VTDLAAAVQAHIDQFNHAVRTGEWAPFVSTFAPDAVMRFSGVPYGPYTGIKEIAEAYRTQPPDDTMTVTGVTTRASDTAVATFTWDAGGGGSMTFRWSAGYVQELTVVFDQAGS
jgi:steroid Delta-isomerase